MPRAQHAYWTVHVTLQGPGGKQSGSGVRDWSCNYCHAEFSSTLTRVIRHCSGIGGKGISGCRAVPREVADLIIAEQATEFRDVPTRRREVAEADDDLLEPVPRPSVSGGAHAEAGSSRPSSSRAQSRKRPTPSATDDEATAGTPASTSATQTIPVEPVATTAPRARQTQLHMPQTGPLSRTWLKERQRLAEIEQARFIIDCNISFNVLQTKQWKRMVRANCNVGPSDDWDGLSYKKMRTTMLTDEKDRIEIALEPVRQGWVRYGCTIMSDGWSDQRRRHIINILVSSCLGTYFLRAVDAGKAGARITAEFIYEHIRRAIIEVGAQNVVQVMTDNASNCKRMGEMVEAEFPSIVWTPCAAHCLDLLMEDFGKLPWISPILEDAERITSFFRKKHTALSIFRSHSDIDIIRPSKTRFAYMYLVLERLVQLQDPLRQTVVDTPWRAWADSSLPVARQIQRRILDDSFFQEMASIVDTLRPIFMLIRVTDREGSTLGLFYHLFCRMRRELIASTSTMLASRYVL